MIRGSFYRGILLPIGLLIGLSLIGSDAPAQESGSGLWHGVERTVRYAPEGRDFVIVNGERRFNRALYGTHTAFRVEAGDLPEFALYMPGMGGNFRFGLIAGDSSKWLIRAQSIRAVYRPGTMIYEIKDPIWGKAVLYMTVLALADAEGLIVKVKRSGDASGRLFCAFGGATGKKFSRDGDIGADPESSFYLRPEYCTGNQYTIAKNNFHFSYGAAQALGGIFPPGALLKVADATRQASPLEMLKSALPAAPAHAQPSAAHQPSAELAPGLSSPALTATLSMEPGQDYYFLIRNAATPADGSKPPEEQFDWYEIRYGKDTTERLQSVPQGSASQSASHTAVLSSGSYAALPGLFGRAEQAREQLADRVQVNTPDPYINTLGGALGIAADAIWEAPSYMHGAVAWRMRLNGWRGPYVADPLGWHDRARMHFSSYALSQITDPNIGPLTPDTALRLARQLERQGTALFSNGYIGRNPGGDIRINHYDMNLVFIDELLDHFFWTGDTAYVRKMWPVLARHLAWEKRNFDRDGDGLYDAYACIWASDALQYSGGGVTHSSAYNYRANAIAAQLAPLIGEDPRPYRLEADKILHAVNDLLWLPAKGWYAEYIDKGDRGARIVHPAAGLWTIYHAIDSRVPDPFQAYQALRYIDTQIPHIPIRAKGLADTSLYTLSTTNWLPYTWSLNNVVMAESLHTALAYWQGGRPEEAWPLWKGALVESMYLGASPGNFQQLSFYDAMRGELYRDFADPIGMAARSLVEGLFGIHPDALQDTLRITPGWPMAWDAASLHIPDIGLEYTRRLNMDLYHIHAVFAKKMCLLLRVRARTDGVGSVTANGRPIAWSAVADPVNGPLLAIVVPSGRSDARADARSDGSPDASSRDRGAEDHAAQPHVAQDYHIAIAWKGDTFDASSSDAISSDTLSASAGFLNIKSGMRLPTYAAGQSLRVNIAKAKIRQVFDPQTALSGISFTDHGLRATVRASEANATFFIRLEQGSFSWWQPFDFHVRRPALAQPAIQNAPVVTGAQYDTIGLTAYFNDRVDRIFRNEYRTPRPASPTLQLPLQGIGNWCYPLVDPVIDDAGLRARAGERNEIILPAGLPLATPGTKGSPNILFTSRWDNFPDSVAIPLKGKASHAYFLLAGSTDPMQSRITNGLIDIRYKDGSADELPLNNPETWWPIEQDYYEDGFAFSVGAPRPLRVYLKTGIVSDKPPGRITIKGFSGTGIDGGAATILDMPLHPGKELDHMVLRTVANDVVIGLMSLTLLRN